MLRLGLFNFRNDEVVLIAGDKAEITALGSCLENEFRSGKAYVPIHKFALVSSRHPVRLFAVKGAFPPPEEGSFLWSCSDADIGRLVTAGSQATELRFDLSRTPPYLYVNFSGHYNETWWATYG
jgi:hypothetical protein